MITTDTTNFRTSAWAQLWRQAATAGTALGREHLKQLVEVLLFAAPEPLALRELCRVTRVPRAVATAVLEEMIEAGSERGVQVVEVLGGYALRTSARFAPLVREVTGKKPVRMSRAQLETLAIVAYRQPITRAEIDEVRGVDSGPVLRTLLDRELVRVIGKKEEPGRPLLYATTDGFLELFGLRALSELPTLREFTELSDDSRATFERRLGESAPQGAVEIDEDAPANDATAGTAADTQPAPEPAGEPSPGPAGEASSEPAPEPADETAGEETGEETDADPSGSA
ncbi:MAG: SMC-Scp complex subunit ScpB [Myxococcales bacterium]|nr:SMC-Scp complex subunit ScpB [Myxococcales bacterium]